MPPILTVERSSPLLTLGALPLLTDTLTILNTSGPAGFFDDSVDLAGGLPLIAPTEKGRYVVSTREVRGQGREAEVVILKLRICRSENTSGYSQADAP